MAEQEMKQPEQEEKKSDKSPYSLTISIIKNKLVMYLHDTSTKYMYTNAFSAHDLQQCGFSDKQVSNLEGVSKFIGKAKEGHQGLQFEMSIEKSVKEIDDDENNEGTHGVDDTALENKQARIGKMSEFGVVKIVKQDDFFGTMNFVMKLKQIPRDKAEVNEDHIRDLMRTIAKLEQCNHELQKHAMPKGGIVMWSGSAINVPNAWRICDGNNGTPDLRNRFIIGASDDIKAQSTGGSKEHNHDITVNGHAITVQEMPSHTHETNYDIGVQPPEIRGYSHSPWTVMKNQREAWKQCSKNTGGGQEHDHTALSSTVTNLPPYYSMC
eukprot:302547_1